MLSSTLLEFVDNHFHPILVLEETSLNIVFGNYQALKIFGYTLDEIKRMSLIDLIESNGEGLQDILSTSKDEKVFMRAVRSCAKQGDKIPLIFHGFFPIPDSPYRLVWFKSSNSLESYTEHHDQLLETYHKQFEELRRTNLDHDYTLVKMELAYQAMEVEVEKRKAAEEQLRLLALTDPLTGIGNRRYFDDNFMREWRRAIRDCEQLTVVMLDIDFFKNYNDIYGHQNGDSCLKLVSEIIASCVKRPGDFIARIGGEEFAIILPNTNQQGAVHVAESIRASIDHACLIHKGSQVTDHVTVSLGFATCLPTEHDSAESFLKRADQALYDAKNAGRNRVKSSLAA